MTVSIYDIYIAELILLLSIIFPIFLLGEIFPSRYGISKRIESLDGLRGMVALFVVASHFQMHWLLKEIGVWKQALPIYSNIGAVAVICFFMVTGFFFCNLIQGKSQINWKEFYIKRVFRLCPLYLCLVVLLVIIAFASEGLRSDQSLCDLAKEIASWMFFTVPALLNIDGYQQTNLVVAGAVWTLRYEWLFYIILPIIGAIFSLFRESKNMPSLLLIAFVVLCFLFADMNIFGYVPRRIAPFALGMLVFQLSSLFNMRRFAQSRTSSTIVVLSFLGSLFESCAYDLSMNMLLFLCLLLICNGNSVFGLLDYKGCRRLGDISYSIYLSHGVVLYFVFIFIKPGSGSSIWMMLPLILTFVAMFSLLTYKYIECPAAEFGRRLSSKCARALPTESFCQHERC